MLNFNTKRIVMKYSVILSLFLWSIYTSAPIFGSEFQRFLIAADQGNADAQYNLGVLYYKGYGVEQNYEEAMKWYLKAANQGYASAQYAIGRLYEKSQGVEQNYEEAMKWYLKAANQGHAAAQCAIALLYEKGYGTEQYTSLF